MYEVRVIAFMTLEIPLDQFSWSPPTHHETIALDVLWVGKDLGAIHHPSGHNAGWATPMALL